MYFREGNDVRLQIHVAVDPKETPLSEIMHMKEELVEKITLSVHQDLAVDRASLYSDPGRGYSDQHSTKLPNSPSLAESWNITTQGTLHARIATDKFYAWYLMHGNAPPGGGEITSTTPGKRMKFRRRDTGKIMYAKSVRPLNPNNIHVTVPRPYSFRRDVVEYAMEHGAEHALSVLEGKEAWRGVLQVRLTRL